MEWWKDARLGMFIHWGGILYLVVSEITLSMVDWYHSKKVFPDTSVVDESYRLLLKTHLKELLTNYGKIDLIWFDMGIDRHKDLNQMYYDMLRKYQPDCIIISRIGNGLCK